MSLLDLLQEWTIVQAETWDKIASETLSSLELPIENVILGRIRIYACPPINARDTWYLLQDRLLARPPNTALVHIIKPKEAYQEGKLIVYKIDKVWKSLIEAHFKFLCPEE